VLHVVRHAQGFHNVNQEYRDIVNLDARLTELGVEQCRQLANRIRQADPNSPLASLASSLQLVVTSPLTRCIQTALLSLRDVLSCSSRDNTIPVLAHELIRETVNYNCDRRRHVNELTNEFGHHVDFSEMDDGTNVHDPIWESYVQDLGDDETYTDHRESGELHVVAERGRRFFEWLAKRPEEHVLICSHAAFLRCLWNFGLSEEVPLQPPQTLDKREDPAKNHPVVEFIGGELFEGSLRRDYENCELRSMVIAFPNNSQAFNLLGVHDYMLTSNTKWL
jgi:broad specificity phosphatase PhoE